MPTFKDISTSLVVLPLVEKIPEYQDPNGMAANLEYAPPPGNIDRATGLEDPFVDVGPSTGRHYISQHESTISVYIPKLTPPDHQFWIHVKAGRPEVGKGYLFKLFFHNQEVVSFGVEERNNFRGSIVFSRRELDDGNSQFSDFCFTQSTDAMRQHGQDPLLNTSPISIDSDTANVVVEGMAPLTIKAYRYRLKRKTLQDETSSSMPLNTMSSSIQ